MVIMIGGNSATPPLRRPAPLGSGVAAVPLLTQAPARPPSESPPFGVGRGPAPDRVRVVERLEDALRPGPGGRIRDPAVRGSGEMGFYRMGLDKAPPPPRGGGGGPTAAIGSHGQRRRTKDIRDTIPWAWLGRDTTVSWVQWSSCALACTALTALPPIPGGGRPPLGSKKLAIHLTVC